MLSTLLLLMFQGSYRTAYPLPDAKVPSGLGVNIHIIEPKDDSIDRIARAGFKWVRMDLMWEAVEYKKGEYDFSGYDKLVAELKKNHLRALFILDYGNKLYGDEAPRTDSEIAGFVRFVHQTVQHYRHQGMVWEIYNEPNIHFWKPEPDVQEYIKLAKAVSEEIRANEPDEWLIGPAMSGYGWEFLSSCFDAGLLKYWDGVSVHPYRETEPESAIPDWQHLRSLIDTSAPQGKHVEMICGEWGYTDTMTGEQTQAQYVVREYLTNLVSGVPLTIWYDWSDDQGDTRDEGQKHFGVVASDLGTKAALVLVRALARELQGYTYISSLSADHEVFLLEFHRDGKKKWVAWSVGSEKTPSLALPAGDYQAAQLGGDARSVTAGGRGLALTLSGTPTVITKS
jgi:hypothetical protein